MEMRDPLSSNPRKKKNERFKKRHAGDHAKNVDAAVERIRK
jgi:hypothetical protein